MTPEDQAAFVAWMKKRGTPETLWHPQAEEAWTAALAYAQSKAKAEKPLEWREASGGGYRFKNPNGYGDIDVETTPLYTHPQPIPKGWKLVPVEPTAKMLDALVKDEWPADWNAGKTLQRKQNATKRPLEECVPFHCQEECAVGKWQRVLAAAPEAPK